MILVPARRAADGASVATVAGLPRVLASDDAGEPARHVGAGVAGYGALILLAWFFRPAVEVLALGATPTKPATAIALLLLGVLLARPGLGPLPRAAALAAAAFAALDGLVAALVGHGLLFGDLLFPAAWAASTPDGDGRMALGTAVGLLCLSIGIATVRRARAVATAAGLIAFGVAYVALLGHLYGVSNLYQIQSATAIGLPTALATGAGAVGLVLYSPAMPLARAVHARGTPGVLVRRLLPWALVLPPFIGWLALVSEQAGLYDTTYGLALMVLAMVAVTLATILVSARTAAGIDGGRERAVEELGALNAVLEERVAAAVTEAEAGRERLALLLERTPVGIFETGADGVRRFTNRRWRELAGVPDGGGIGESWTAALHPDDRDTVTALWAEARRNGSEFTARYRYRRPDGEVTWVDAACVAMRDSRGEVTRWLGSVTDVTEQVHARERLAESESRYRSVVSAMAEGVVLQDPQGRIVTVNDAACTLLGVYPAEITGRNVADRSWLTVREDGSELPVDERPSMVALRTGRPVRGVTMGVQRADGSFVWLAVNAEPLLQEDPGGTPVVVGAVTTFADVTATRRAIDALRRSEEQFRSAMRHAPVGMALVELDGSFREVNRALCRIVGYDEDELVGRTFRLVTHPDDLENDLDEVARLLEGSLDHYSVEKRYLTKHGDLLWVLLAVSCATDADGRPEYFVAQIQDITAERAAREQLTHRALHDRLTGLPNRDLLMDRLAHALARAERAEGSTAVMFCDLDGFKAVNDAHGHAEGDRLLVSVASRLRRSVRPGDTVARLGGDEFVIVAEDLPDGAAVLALADRVRTALVEPVLVGGSKVVVEGSIGVAVAGTEDDAPSLLARADAAMYRAKARGKGTVEMSPAADVPSPHYRAASAAVASARSAVAAGPRSGEG